MDKSSHDEPMLELQCNKCNQRFYWGAVYNSVSCLTKCPTCKASNLKGATFKILKHIYEGTKA